MLAGEKPQSPYPASTSPWWLCASTVSGGLTHQRPAAQPSSATNSDGISASNMLPPQLGVTSVPAYGSAPSYTGVSKYVCVVPCGSVSVQLQSQLSGNARLVPNTARGGIWPLAMPM